MMALDIFMVVFADKTPTLEEGNSKGR